MWNFLRPDSLSILKDQACRKSLQRYFDVLQDLKPSRFILANKIPLNYKEHESLSKLWKTHRDGLKKLTHLTRDVDTGAKRIEDLENPSKSLLDLKIEISKHLMERCSLCERRCKVNRKAGKLGFCKCGNETCISTFFEHMGEEPELVPSGTIFTCGCTLRCLHCQNWTISQWMEKGQLTKPEKLATIVEELKKNGCRNANLVGGDPTSWLPMWLETFKHVNVNIAVVWNSNSYYSKEAAELLKGFADVYLLDFKYGPGRCSQRISSAPGYWEAATRNHLEARRWGELIIRILVLPGHLECCYKPILDWISEKLGLDTRINIMFQYRPEWRANEVPELERCLTGDERMIAVKLARKLGFLNFIT